MALYLPMYIWNKQKYFYQMNLHLFDMKIVRLYFFVCLKNVRNLMEPASQSLYFNTRWHCHSIWTDCCS